VAFRRRFGLVSSNTIALATMVTLVAHVRNDSS